jgi:hypothetical protein
MRSHPNVGMAGFFLDNRSIGILMRSGCFRFFLHQRVHGYRKCLIEKEGMYDESG